MQNRNALLPWSEKGHSVLVDEKRKRSEKPELFFFFEVVFGCAANRTCPIPGHIFPFGTWIHAIVGIARFRVVNIAAECAYIPVH
jgi:hypothetical protein